eukprot:3715286-Rhodomonas_salina.1
MLNAKIEGATWNKHTQSELNASLSAAFKGNIGAYDLLNAKIEGATGNKHTQSESNASLTRIERPRHQHTSVT